MSNFLKMLLSFICFLFVTIFAEVGATANECVISRCSHHGPAIRFPFWLKDSQPDHCGYPGFQLSCTEKHQTMIELPNSVKLLVKKINYKSQEIQVYDPADCLPKQLSDLNLSASPFQFKVKHDHSLQDITLLNCSLPANRGFMRQSLAQVSLATNKMHNISSVPNDIFEHFYLNWSKPICRNCEADGKRCRLKSNSTEPETECFIISKKAQGTAVR
ncbi:putative RING-H2 finger protein ATL21A [Vitis vinifera]|uniref:RING-type E3 ubiquitin transferase n=1 Tax=Vitis vinifera TaxID=29760 RepID=A0A438CH67_VITVI|nr:putative RING-H2 finger protein ATL21A [Vitis vinifera]